MQSVNWEQIEKKKQQSQQQESLEPESKTEGADWGKRSSPESARGLMLWDAPPTKHLVWVSELEEAASVWTHGADKEGGTTPRWAQCTHPRLCVGFLSQELHAFSSDGGQRVQASQAGTKVVDDCAQIHWRGQHLELKQVGTPNI